MNATTYSTSSRSHHETRAIECIAEASRYLGGYGAAGVVRANRAIVAARVHLTSIGTFDGPRTKKLWAVACRVERRVTVATEKMLAEVA